MNANRRSFLIAAATAPAWVSLPALASTTASVVHVSLWDNPDKPMASGLDYDMSKANMGIKLSKTKVPAGKVNFEVTNTSTVLVHEMVVAPIEKVGEPLPYDANADRVLEDEAGHLGEVAELEPGKSGALTLDLKPGEYLLYCNVPMHFSGGMWSVLTVS